MEKSCLFHLRIPSLLQCAAGKNSYKPTLLLLPCVPSSQQKQDLRISFQYQTGQISTHKIQHTQDTTLPLKQGSFALSSEISSFTTLENKKNNQRKKIRNLKSHQIRMDSVFIILSRKNTIFSLKCGCQQVLCA